MLNDLALHLASDVETYFDEFKVRFLRPLDYSRLMIMPYVGHGNRFRVELHGRVLESRGIESAKDNDTIWKNLVNMYRRFDSHEVRYAVVQAEFHGQKEQFKANNEGFFDVLFEFDDPLDINETFVEMNLELVDCPTCPDDFEPVTNTAQIIIPPVTAEFGVISDLDDTVIQTNVTNILKMARNTFFKNSRTRLPFEGVAAFYQALQHGTNKGFNPIYYVSNSPWNLYDLLRDFFDVRGIPLGPFFLRDLGLTPNHWIAKPGHKHKLGVIEKLLALHPELPFILIGDSSEHDAEIYAEAIQRNPGRILAAYIRDVTRDDGADRVVLDISEGIGEVPMMLVPDTVAAARHAIEQGFIPPEFLDNIQEEKERDEEEPEPLEQLLSSDEDALKEE
jgi:phosphatidate phosphatase APP1